MLIQLFRLRKKKVESRSPREEQRDLKLREEDLQRKGKKDILLLSIYCGAGVGFILFLYVYATNENKPLVLMVIVSIVSGIIFGLATFLLGSIEREGTELKIKRDLLKFETDDIQEQVQEDIFENSIKMSYNYLDQYYAQTREQAQKGFFITVCVSLLGAFLIGIGIIAMFLEKTTPSYVTCASGIITEFIAAVFFYLYNKTVISMSKYHNKLVLSHNISIALKVAESLPDDDKVKTKDLIISELLKDINSYLIRNDSEEGKK